MKTQEKPNKTNNKRNGSTLATGVGQARAAHVDDASVPLIDATIRESWFDRVATLKQRKRESVSSS